MRFWFPVFLVLFEFSTYVSIDMIMPGMPRVVHDFHASIGSASFALSAALLGNISLQWLLGPLSDHRGRRPVLLAGVACFILSCVAMYGARTMGQFVWLRALQGAGVAFVAAVGYPSVQEAFDETQAVRTVALMASVALLAPLLGPILGALIVTWASWRSIFGLIAALASLALYGLWRHMPETANRASDHPLTLRRLLGDYRPVLRDTRILSACVTLGCACIPLMNWIALAPVIFIEREGMTPVRYGVWQLPVFGAMIVGHIVVARLAGRRTLDQVMRLGLYAMLGGAALAVAGQIASGGFTGAVPGYALYALGIGPCYAAIYRQALFASSARKGTVAATINTVFVLVMALGVEVSKTIYIAWGEAALLGLNLAVALLAACGAAIFVYRMREDRAGADGELDPMPS